VLQLLVEGLPNKLIARRLQISEKTVKSHPTRIFRELGVTEPAQAALSAKRHGLGSDFASGARSTASMVPTR
jgi:DNA-binding NarL/FixJ family response regulator